MMNDCKDCRYYRPDKIFFLPPMRHGFARCDRTNNDLLLNGLIAFARVERKYDIACGSEGRFFEPLHLGRSHGIDWGRVRDFVQSLSDIRRFVAEPFDGFITFPGLMSIEQARVISDALRPLAPPSAHFTAAEYLAALTTDYCAADAAE